MPTFVPNLSPLRWAVVTDGNAEHRLPIVAWVQNNVYKSLEAMVIPVNESRHAIPLSEALGARAFIGYE